MKERVTLIQKLVKDARAVDRNEHLGLIGVAVKAGRFQVQRVTYNAKGISTVTKRSPWVRENMLTETLVEMTSNER